MYLMGAGGAGYEMFHLKNREFTFDVDVSNLPCGLNGALYFVEMDQDGGLSEYPTNKAGAKYGTGYCDAQCPQDVKFINGLVRCISASFYDAVLMPNRPTSTIGLLPLEIRIVVLDHTAPAAMRWISGRRTPSLRRSHLMCARRLAKRCAPAPPSVEQEPIDMMELG